jgi:glycosyltransferase involved in cell wall biosynthesis
MPARFQALHAGLLEAKRHPPPTSSDRPHVLHVVESLSSGVATAIEDYLRSTPGCRHTVLAWRRGEAQTGDRLDVLASELLPMPPGRAAQARSVRRHIKRLRPDIVHAHSSYAGLYVRAFTSQPARSLVYTPHGYSFERRDVPRPVRALFWLVEALLSFRGATVAAVSPREARLAAGLPGRQRVTYLPHVVGVGQPVGPGPSPDADGPLSLRLAALGRIAPQKDPQFFRRAVLLSRPTALPIKWIWIGGGDPSAELALRQAGVHVTGWVSRAEALGWLATADVYVHTATWEGWPVSLLEAAALGLPCVARRSAALAMLDPELLFDTPQELVELVRSLTDERRRTDFGERSRRLLEQHRPEAQRAALEQVYGIAPRPC